MNEKHRSEYHMKWKWEWKINLDGIKVFENKAKIRRQEKIKQKGRENRQTNRKRVEEKLQERKMKSVKIYQKEREQRSKRR